MQLRAITCSDVQLHAKTCKRMLTCNDLQKHAKTVDLQSLAKTVDVQSLAKTVDMQSLAKSYCSVKARGHGFFKILFFFNFTKLQETLIVALPHLWKKMLRKSQKDLPQWELGRKMVNDPALLQCLMAIFLAPNKVTLWPKLATSKSPFTKVEY